MVDIKIDTSPTYRRSRRSSGFGQGLTRLVFFFATLVPTCIIAWRIDLVNPRQPVVIQPAQPKELPQPLRPATPRRIDPRPHTEQRPSTLPSIPEKSKNVDEIHVVHTSPPARAEKPKPRPSQSFAVDFRRRVQREEITLIGALRIARVDDCKYSIEPPDGIIVDQVGVTLLDGPRHIHVAVSLLERNGSQFILLEPTVTTDFNEKVPFTVGNMESIGIRAFRDRRNAIALVNSMKAELAQLEALLKSPVLKPVPVYNRAQARIPELKALIPESEKNVAALDVQVKATKELYDYARQIQGAYSIVIESGSD